MIIGTRLEYCLSDILLNEVDIDYVYVIIADNQFNFNDLNSYSSWWDRQMDPMTQHLSRGKNSLHLFGYEECLIRVQQLVEDGKIAFRNDAIISKMLSDVIELAKIFFCSMFAHCIHFCFIGASSNIYIASCTSHATGGLRRYSAGHTYK